MESLGKFVQLRPLVKGVKYDDWITSDWSLVHYLRAKDLDVNAAVSMLKEGGSYKNDFKLNLIPFILNLKRIKAVLWRQKNKIDSILSENIIELNPPFNTDSTAKDGSPGTPCSNPAFSISRI